MTDKLKKINFLIVILCILLAITLAALAFVHFWGKNASGVAPDNYILPQTERSSGHLPSGLYASPLRTVISSSRAKETVLSIYKNHAEDSTPFNSPNLFPGDSESKKYLVEVSHRGTVTVRFRADIRAGYDKLAEVLMCRVEVAGEGALYDGLMRDMPESLNCRISSVFKKTTDLVYTVTVYLETSVGNEYMDRELVADFRWWVEESSRPGESSAIITQPYHPETEPLLPDESTAEISMPEFSTESESTAAPIVTDEPTVTDETTDEPIVTDEPTDTDEPIVTAEPTVTEEIITEETTEDPEDTGELVSPPTGDSFHSLLWLLLLLAAIVIGRMLSKSARREYGEEGER